MGGKPGVVAGEINALFAATSFILVWGYMALNYRASASMFPAVFLAIVAGAHLRYAVDLYRNLYPISYIKCCVAGLSLYSAALISSWWKNTRATVVWK